MGKRSAKCKKPSLERNTSLLGWVVESPFVSGPSLRPGCRKRRSAEGVRSLFFRFWDSFGHFLVSFSDASLTFLALTPLGGQICVKHLKNPSFIVKNGHETPPPKRWGFSCFNCSSSFLSLPFSAIVSLLFRCSLTFSGLELAHPVVLEALFSSLICQTPLAGLLFRTKSSVKLFDLEVSGKLLSG